MGTKLSSVDTAWYRLEAPDDPVDISVLLELDGRVDLGRLRSTITERLLGFERFRLRIVEPRGRLTGPTWEPDPAFAIERHVARASLGGASLAAWVGERISKPLPMDRPLWQMLVVDDLPGGTVVLARLHHCIADGFALVRLMLSLADDGLGDELRAPDPEHASFLARVLDEAWDLGTDPAHAAAVARDAGRVAAALGHLVLLPFERDSVLRARVSGHRRVAWSSGTPLDRVKVIGRGLGGTVNDVLLAAMTGALRRALAAAGDPLDGPVRAIVPVNLRPARSIEQMPLELGNRFGLVFLELPVHADTARARVALLEQDMRRLKASEEAIVAFGILTAIGASPAVVEHVVAELFGRKASLVATNVPGPTHRLAFAGASIRRIVFWVPHPAKLGVGVSILSYAGEVVVGVRVDEAVRVDPEALVRAFEQELGELARAAGAA